jgi:hypothetical protein
MRTGDIGRAFLAALALVLLFAAWGWVRDRELRELTQLPAETRRGLYERTMANLTTVCAGPDAPKVEPFCQEQAAVALRLPECDAHCTRIARSHLVSPAR